MSETVEIIKNSRIDSPKVIIRAFRAIDDVESAMRFVEGHRRVLLAHGVKKVTSSSAEWVKNPHAYVIIVEDVHGEKVYGGARVHLYHKDYPLPIQDATGPMDPRVHSIVEEIHAGGKTSELCGLWNSYEVAGLGIGSFFATRAGVAVAYQLGIKSMFALCAPYTVKWAMRVGCEIVSGMGNEGTFFYPKLDLIATAVLLRDTGALERAKPSERKRIHDFIDNPDQVAMETPPGRRFQVAIDYRLKVASEHA
jgi:hypothetical protein